MILIEILKSIKWRVVNYRNRAWLNKGEEEYKKALEQWYFDSTGKKLDVDNPRTLNEKIQWLKLYDSTLLKAKLTDKLQVREWVEEKIGGEYLIPQLGNWERVEDIKFEELPNQFVLKTNHASGTNIIVHDKSKISWLETKMKLKRWLSTNYALKMGFELHYGMIQPKIICEQYMGEEIEDYKVFCINGEPQFVWVDKDRFSGHKRNFYDLEWKLLPFKINNYERCDVERPQNFEKMLSLARILAEGFACVRVDFYEIDGKLYFGEMTFTSGSGNTQWDPEEYDLKYGQKMILPSKSVLPLEYIKKVWK